jgi:uncharacterized damage-inducible protein DinB
MPNASDAFIDPAAMLAHWQGHRRLSRRMIDAFPEDKLFSYSIGGMRTFGALAMEMLAMTVPMVRGVVHEKWDAFSTDRESPSKQEVLRRWDESTRQLDELWPQIPLDRFHATMKAFGQYEGKVNELLLYCIDNEIHHRGQGYVYLRSLGIEPPPFYERE